MKYEIIDMNQFAEIWQSALDNSDSVDIPNSLAVIHPLITFDEEDAIVVMCGENGVLIRP